MSLKDLKIDSDITADVEKDVVPGTGGFILPTGAYRMRVKVAYMSKSQGGAHAVNLQLEDTANGDKVFKHTIYITNKQGETFYVNGKGAKIFLPGYQTACAITNMAIGSDIIPAVTEDKMVKLWDYDAREELPTKVETLVDMKGKILTLGIVEGLENKREFNETLNKWEDIAETKAFNEIEKVFNADGLSKIEIAGGRTEPEFLNVWKAKRPSDFIKDKSKKIAPSASSASATAAKTVDVDDLFD